MKFRTSRWHWQKGALIDNIFHPAMFLPRRSQRARPLMALCGHPCSTLVGEAHIPDPRFSVR
jgi:hypothetical protein